MTNCYRSSMDSKHSPKFSWSERNLGIGQNTHHHSASIVLLPDFTPKDNYWKCGLDNCSENVELYIFETNKIALNLTKSLVIFPVYYIIYLFKCEMIEICLQLNRIKIESWNMLLDINLQLNRIRGAEKNTSGAFCQYWTLNKRIKGGKAWNELTNR